jgi:hypothetical protein
MKARLPLTLALVVALSPLKASAQAWVGNTDYSEGIGIRAGNLELHPSVGAEAGYDSNFFRSSGAAGNSSERIVDVWKFRVTPSLSFSTLGHKRLGNTTPGPIKFTGGAFASFYQPIAVDSENSEVSKRRNAQLGANAELHVFPQGRVGFDLLAAYLRLTQPEGRSDDLAGEGFNRDTLRGGGGVTWRPGGGLFEWRAGYLATYNIFENRTYDTLDNLHHDFDVRGRWRFLPRTSLLFDSKYTLVRYTHDNTQQTDGDAVRTRIGLRGLVTYHLALMGMLGWGASFYEPRPNAIAPRQFDSMLANAEARWFIQPKPDLDSATVATGLSSVALGYARTFNNSYYGSFFQRDRGYLQFNVFLLGALTGGLEFGVSRVAYPDVVIGGVSEPSFNQLRLDGVLFTEYRLTDTLAVNGTLQYDQANSRIVRDEDLDFKRWQAYLGVRWFM